MARVVAAPGATARALKLGPRPLRRPHCRCLRDREEAVAERLAECVPLLDVLGGLGREGLPGPDLVWAIGDPALDLRPGHLGVKLDPPGPVAQPERLRADAAPRKLDGACGKTVRVVVPLEGEEAVREPAEDRIVACFPGQLDRGPADLGLGRRADRRMRRLGQELRAQADPEHG